MKLKCLSAATLGLALLASPAPSQTAAEHMQKAIYAHQTAGDLDDAIRIYRQILTSAPDRKTAAEAQFRLAQALLQKGDLDQAAREFQVLANYSEYKEAIAALAARLPKHSDAPIVHFSSGASGSVIRHGKYTTETGNGGAYLHPTGIQLTIPPGWTILDTDPDFVMVMVGGTNGSIRVVFNPESTLATTLLAQLKVDPPGSPATGPHSAASMGCPDSSTNRVPAVAWKGFGKRNVFFIGESSGADCRLFQRGFMQLVTSTVVP
jgi:tetratricopeptide (TPR) repeat protein